MNEKKTQSSLTFGVKCREISKNCIQFFAPEKCDDHFVHDGKTSGDLMENVNGLFDINRGGLPYQSDGRYQNWCYSYN